MNPKIDIFVDELAQVKSNQKMFNQYCNDCPVGDYKGAYLDRLDNLKKYLNHLCSLRPRIMIVGESAGHNGAKFHGLQLTNYKVAQRIGCNNLKYCFKSDYLSSKTEDLIWDLADKTKQQILTFNIVPFFTKFEDDWNKNRPPSIIEIEKYSIFTAKLYLIFYPIIVVALGRKAQFGLNFQQIPNVYMRHPSMGGHGIFKKQFLNLTEELT